jgi:hypothetical protein
MDISTALLVMDIQTRHPGQDRRKDRQRIDRQAEILTIHQWDNR